MFERRRHPGLFFIHGSIAWPMRSPVNASPIRSRHDSWSMWIATPSPWWTLTTDFLPVSRRTQTKEWTQRSEGLMFAEQVEWPRVVVTFWRDGLVTSPKYAVTRAR
jgi:hypothetical protein